MKKVVITGLILLLSAGSLMAKPPKPGNDFVWVVKYRTPSGTVILGHWKYVGKPRPGHIWIPGHYDRRGCWHVGHWAKRPRPPHSKCRWIPGHRNHHGWWVQGHWRCK